MLTLVLTQSHRGRLWCHGDEGPRTITYTFILGYDSTRENGIVGSGRCTTGGIRCRND